MRSSSAPLAGLRIIELAGLGPAPFAGMMLADHGAEVIRIDRLHDDGEFMADPLRDVLRRSRRTIRLNLKAPEGQEIVRALASSAHGLVEGFRPGTMERLNLGPDVLLDINPGLVFGRVTGWGQDGPLSRAAGHDINYIAMSGMLHGLGRAGDKPTPPLSLLGDFAGGGMLLAFGMLAALLHVRSGGAGQVIDCSMTEGAALVGAMIWGMRAQGMFPRPRGLNAVDTGSHFYDTYETSDGKWIAVGAIEPRFYRLLLDKLGLDSLDADAQVTVSEWPEMKHRFAELFRTKTRAEWCALLEGTDACFAPVLDPGEVSQHPHHRSRESFVDIGGVVQPAPAPRYSRTSTVKPRMPRSDTDTDQILSELAYDPPAIERLRRLSIIA